MADNSWDQQWPYCVKITRADWDLAQIWCDENLGAFDQAWYKLGIDPLASIFEDTTTIWYFRNSQDAVAFALKWA